MPQSEYVSAPLRNFAVGNTNDIRNPGVVKAALAEMFSTLIFVFAGTGSSLAYNKLTGNGHASPSGIVASALAHGFGLFVAVAVSFNISGGHVNPAVTFGLMVAGNISLVRGVLYIIAQLVGSIVACLLLVVSTGTWGIPVIGVTGISVWSAFLFEIVLTFGLVYTVYATAADPKKGEIGILAPLAIGLIVGANILAGGPFSGAAMNPALAFGPALVTMTWAYHWIYWAGPLIGGGLAGVVFEVFFISHSHEQVPGDDY